MQLQGSFSINKSLEDSDSAENNNLEPNRLWKGFRSVCSATISFILRYVTNSIYPTDNPLPFHTRAGISNLLRPTEITQQNVSFAGHVDHQLSWVFSERTIGVFWLPLKAEVDIRKLQSLEIAFNWDKTEHRQRDGLEVRMSFSWRWQKKELGWTSTN